MAVQIVMDHTGDTLAGGLPELAGGCRFRTSRASAAIGGKGGSISSISALDSFETFGPMERPWHSTHSEPWAQRRPGRDVVPSPA
jgi:hypothetical protein